MAEWVMVAITAIYSIVTIIMCIFNYRALRLSQKQIEEMKRQYSEQKLSNSMPIMQIKSIPYSDELNGKTTCVLYSSSDDMKGCKISEPLQFSIINVGQGIAKNVTYNWVNVNNHNYQPFIASLPVCDSRIFQIVFVAAQGSKNTTSPFMRICFEDYNGNAYYQTLDFHLSIGRNSISLINTSITVPEKQNDKIK